MSGERLLSLIQQESEGTISVRQQLLASLRDAEYRHEFVRERVHSSVALQIRALRKQRNNMTQAELGAAIGMAQTWVSKLENPEYGKMTVETLLRLAVAFDADLEIKFRPFSRTLDTLPNQGPEYFYVPSFTDEFETSEADTAGASRYAYGDATQYTITATTGLGSVGSDDTQYDQLSRIGPGLELSTAVGARERATG
jgi:transcriptional regulator with XRE-family HTH domain